MLPVAASRAAPACCCSRPPCSPRVRPCRSSARAARAGKAGVAESSAGQRVKLGLNKSVVIDLPADAYDILVANPEVADAVTRTARRIYLFGKSVGETNIFVFGPNGEQIVSLDLAVERDVSGLEDYLKRYIPDSDITVELLNDNVVLSGTVETPLDAKRASDLATIFVSGGEATTGQYSQTAAGGDAAGGVDIDNPDEERRVSQIVNLLKIIGDDQVTLKVTVAEVSRSVMKQLGVNMIGRRQPTVQLGRHLRKFVWPRQAAFASRFARHLDARRLCQRHGAGWRDEDAGRADAHRGLRREGDLPGRRRVQSGHRTRRRLRRPARIDLRHREARIRHRSGVSAGRAVPRSHQPEIENVRFGTYNRGIGAVRSWPP